MVWFPELTYANRQLTQFLAQGYGRTLHNHGAELLEGKALPCEDWEANSQQRRDMVPRLACREWHLNSRPRVITAQYLFLLIQGLPSIHVTGNPVS